MPSGKIVRRDFLKFVGLGAAATQIPDWIEQAAYAKNEPSEKGSRPRPNFLWICPDQQRWDTIGALGNKFIHTPNLDRIVKMGTSFTMAHCVSPICTASRANFLTGMYPSAVAGCKNGAAYWPEKAPIVTKLLKDAGYVCGLAGKLHLSSGYGEKVEKRPKDDGYSEFHHSLGPYSNGQANEYLQWLKQKGLNYEQVRKLPWVQQSPLHQTTWCCDKAIDFINTHKEIPWLFSLNMHDPHVPYSPPKDYLEHCGYDLNKIPRPPFKESDLKEKDPFGHSPKNMNELEVKKLLTRYWAMIELIDENLGRVLKILEKTGQLDNTIIIFTSDHGDMAGDHNMGSKGKYFYEGVARVPLIFAGPGICKNRRCDSLVELTEVTPTILELAGEPIPTRMQGKSLLPVLKGKTMDCREFVHGQYYACTGPAPGSPNSIERFVTMYRDKRYKHVVYHGLGKGELFDMQADPDEFTNLWDEPKSRSKRDEIFLKSFSAAAIANYPVMPVMATSSSAREKLGLKDANARFENKPDKDQPGHWISIFDDGLFRLEVCHGSGKVKLFDKEKTDIWNKPGNTEMKFNILRRCFDAFVFSIDTGPERIGRY